MNALEQAREFIARDAAHPHALAMTTLIEALQAEGPFDLGALYQLDIECFELALRMLRDWRLQRYYLGPAATEPHWSARQ